jgi:hypothetical protein
MVVLAALGFEKTTINLKPVRGVFEEGGGLIGLVG